MKKLFSKTLMACAVTGVLGLASSAAMAFPTFTVNETAVKPGVTLPNSFTADKITGNYVEVISFTNTTATSGSFDVSLRWNAGQFVANNGSTPASTQLGSFTANQYGLYALYQGKGTFSGTGTRTTFSFVPGGNLNLFLDPNHDTTFAQPASGTMAFATGNNADDRLIASGVPTSGQGTLDPTLSTCTGGGGNGINCGSFGTSSTLSLTSAGSQYFTAPNPFYNVSFQSGQLNNFTPSGTQVINGSLDVIFGTAVPEPGSVALIGLGLLGLGLSRRRKQA